MSFLNKTILPVKAKKIEKPMDNSERFSKLFKNVSLGTEFEHKVFNFLKSKSTEEEVLGLIPNKHLDNIGPYSNVDIYLGKGIASLGWPPKTVVEVKTYLDFQRLRSSYNLFQKIQTENPSIKNFVIIYKESGFSFPPQFQGENSNIEVVKFEDLVSKADFPEKGSVHEERNGEAIDPTEEITEKQSNGGDNEKPFDSNTLNPWKARRENIINTLREELREDTFTLILGAGVSASANMPSWGKLLELILTEHPKEGSPRYLPCDFSNILHSCGDSYIIAARYINKIIKEEIRAKTIQEVLYKSTKRRESNLIKGICKLVKEYGINSILTTNYDQLIEQYLKLEGLLPYPVAQCGIIPKDSVAVFHVHGVVNDPENPLSDNIPEAPILSEDDYHALYSKGHDWSNITILNALQHSHCVFIGFSMTDPNLRRLMESAKYNDATPHYLFLPRKPLYEGYYDDDRRNNFHYQVQEEIMASMGVNIIWYELSKNGDAHSELTTLIEQLIPDFHATVEELNDLQP